MRSLIVVGALAAVAAADTKPPPPKPSPPRVAKAAAEAFAAAQEADQRGDLPGAIRQYERAIAIAPHPNATYNLADVHRRAKHISNAIALYRTYLELAPDAADRAAVEATIDELGKLRGTLEITAEEPRGRVFVDGVAVGEAPIKVPVAPGTHMIDLVTPITYGYAVCTVSALGSSSCRVHGKPRVDGNVILSGSWIMGGRSWPVKGQPFHLRGRFQAAAGTYELDLVDRPCAPVKLDVPAKGFIYAFVTYRKPERGACTDITLAQQPIAIED